ncbi:30S ribosomal protein S21 [Patescibacteria group bacterium]|jgi:ribosomal protein S21|nr:30S ribosomal protein S21 [Patescibacteria group bacterium]
MVNVEVTKNQNENSGSVIRRFTKRTQSSGIIPRVRKLRYYTRQKSRNFQKHAALESTKRRERLHELAKHGLLKPAKKRR